MYDFSLVASLLVSIVFTPFMFWLVLQHTRNLMHGESQNMRFSKFKKQNASDQAIARIAMMTSDEDTDSGNYETQNKQLLSRDELSKLSISTTV